MITTSFSRASLCGALTLFVFLSGCGRAPETPQPVRSVRTLVLSEVGGTAEREYSGEIRARVESQVGFQVPGKVVRRLVNVGDTVTVGQALAELDPTDLRLTAQAAQAALSAAQAQASQAVAVQQAYGAAQDQQHDQALQTYMQQQIQYQQQMQEYIQKQQEYIQKQNGQQQQQNAQQQNGQDQYAQQQNGQEQEANPQVISGFQLLSPIKQITTGFFTMPC